MSKEVHSGSSPLDYNLIVDGIYVGRTIGGDEALDEALKGEGISADVSLEKNHVDTPFGATFFVWIPVIDHWALSMDQLHFGTSVLEELVGMGRKVYLHCENGHGRSPSLLTAYLIAKGMTVAEAHAFMKTKRPSIDLNERQIQSLEAFYAHWAEEHPR